MSENIKKISAFNIFNNNYIIPIYQRNYAWDSDQIEQLIDDIESTVINYTENYFIGNLIVNKTINNLFEVIDGQQRLTTLYLILKYLRISLQNDSLKFEARERSNRTLSSDDLNNLKLPEELTSEEILSGYKVISKYFENKKIEKDSFIKKLKNVFFVRVKVPKNIDLNHYFEVMNTRGEQLELHQIVKAKLLSALKSKEDKNIASMIWEKCSDMNSYIQMNFSVDVRNAIFTENWDELSIQVINFDSLKKKASIGNDSISNKTLLDMINKNKLSDINNAKEDEEKERFESIISFPNFLLQVNVALKKSMEEDANLNDNNFLKNLTWTWSNTENAKNYLFHLLKCRVLFDQYIIKREFIGDYKDIGKWSLQRLKKYKDNNNYDKAEYVGTFNSKEELNKQFRTLQSCLRITYTSPKTMHWISIVISELLKEQKPVLINLINLLENYCKEKIVESDYKNMSGFAFERIIFSYLDYLLYRDGYTYNKNQYISPLQDNWQFQFRNSIEHFHPQNPTEVETWNEKSLNRFGNLALITISGNSKFSNLPPIGKINSYPSIINQSLKLKIMDELTKCSNDGWTEEKAKAHEKEMFKILENNL